MGQEDIRETKQKASNSGLLLNTDVNGVVQSLEVEQPALYHQRLNEAIKSFRMEPDHSNEQEFEEILEDYEIFLDTMEK